jgi:methyltransferase (TIGR00027 family)
MGIVVTMIVRTKFIDEHLSAAIAAGATQVVILGAGWDTRAYRLGELLQGVRVYEVDRPALQEWKRRRAAEELGPAPANLTYLPADLARQKLADVMAGSDYDPARRTFFIWEGVTMYLPEAAVRETLSWIVAQAPGSAVVFDFADKEVVDFMTRVDQGYQPSTTVGQIAAERGKQLAQWGEPWIFGLDTGTAGEYVAALGFEHRETLVLASVEAARRYLGWEQDREFPVPIRRMYSIMEAVVPQR